MTNVTQKYIKDNYSYDEILKAGPKTEKRRRDINLIYYTNLAELLKEIEGMSVSFEDVYFSDVAKYDDSETVAYFHYTHVLTELERFKEGLRILQEREQTKQNKLKQEERDRKELERLKKKLGKSDGT